MEVEEVKEDGPRGPPGYCPWRLFYDNKHLVKGDQDRDNGEPKRFSLWEIHPVSAFYVCVRADRKCAQTLAKPNDWKRLEDF